MLNSTPPVPDSPIASEKELLKSIKQGTPSERKGAFAVLYQWYHLDVWWFIRNKVDSKDTADDIFGSVWCVALAKLPTFVWRGVSIKYWLLKIAKIKMLEFYRKVKEENYIVSLNEERYAERSSLVESTLRRNEDPLPTPSFLEAKREADRLLHKALSELDPRQRKIIILIYYKGKNSTEIARELGMTPGAVRVTHKRVLEKLRKLLGDVPLGK